MCSRTLLATMAFIGSLGALSVSAVAQQPTPAPATMPDYTPGDLKAVLNARIAALKAVIDLTPDQEKLWPPVEAAIRDIARNGAERLKQRKAVKAGSFLDVLGQVAAGEEARAADIRKFIAAAKPLVDSLSPEQRRRMPAFLGMTDYPGQPSGNLWFFQDEEG